MLPRNDFSQLLSYISSEEFNSFKDFIYKRHINDKYLLQIHYYKMFGINDKNDLIYQNGLSSSIYETKKIIHHFFYNLVHKIKQEEQSNFELYDLLKTKSYSLVQFSSNEDRVHFHKDFEKIFIKAFQEDVQNKIIFLSSYREKVSSLLKPNNDNSFDNLNQQNAEYNHIDLNQLICFINSEIQFLETNMYCEHITEHIAFHNFFKYIKPEAVLSLLTATDFTQMEKIAVKVAKTMQAETIKDITKIFKEMFDQFLKTKRIVKSPKKKILKNLKTILEYKEIELKKNRTIQEIVDDIDIGFKKVNKGSFELIHDFDNENGLKYRCPKSTLRDHFNKYAPIIQTIYRLKSEFANPYEAFRRLKPEECSRLETKYCK